MKSYLIGEMKQYKKLDRTLDLLIAKKDPYGMRSADIHEMLKVADDQLEQHLILEMLANDGYVIRNMETNSDTKEEIHKLNPFFIITYEGIVYKELGGYEVEYAIRKRELTNRKIISHLNPAWQIIRFIAAILGLIFLVIGGIKLFFP